MITVDQAIRDWLSMRHRTGEITARSHRDLLPRLAAFRAVCGHREVGAVASSNIDEWLESIAHLSAATRRHYFTSVRMFFDWAIAEGLAERNLLRGRRAPREPRRLPRALPAKAVAAILDACPDQRTRVAVVLMVQLGLRRGEVARVRIEDIDRFAETLLVHGKGGHERLLPITRQALAEVEAHMAETGATEGPLLRSTTAPDQGLKPETVSVLVTRAMRDAGVKRTGTDRVTPHALRHTMATDLVRSGAHLLDIQQALGHTSLTVTQTYLPMNVDGLSAAMEGRWYGQEAERVDR